ncbi:hypothetical protein FOZ63_012577, partial [Perkinsus olseni]
ESSNFGGGRLSCALKADLGYTVVPRRETLPLVTGSPAVSQQDSLLLDNTYYGYLLLIANEVIGCVTAKGAADDRLAVTIPHCRHMGTFSGSYLMEAQHHPTWVTQALYKKDNQCLSAE